MLKVWDKVSKLQNTITQGLRLSFHISKEREQEKETNYMPLQ